MTAPPRLGPSTAGSQRSDQVVGRVGEELTSPSRMDSALQSHRTTVQARRELVGWGTERQLEVPAGWTSEPAVTRYPFRNPLRDFHPIGLHPSGLFFVVGIHAFAHASSPSACLLATDHQVLEDCTNIFEDHPNKAGARSPTFREVRGTSRV